MLRLELGDGTEAWMRDAGSYTRWRYRAELDTSSACKANSLELGRR
jgi:hypothetical protein